MPDATHTPDWQDVGAADALALRPIQTVRAGKRDLALTFKDGAFHAISGVCNHAGGPLGAGRCDGDYVVCPWHGWRYHHRTGQGEPGYEADQVPVHAVKVEAGRVWVDANPSTPRTRKPHPQTRSVGSPPAGSPAAPRSTPPGGCWASARPT